MYSNPVCSLSLSAPFHINLALAYGKAKVTTFIYITKFLNNKH